MKQHSASFRDPSGYLFTHRNVLFRAVNPSYQKHYEHFVGSGLKAKLDERELLIPFEDFAREDGMPEAWKILRPQPVPFISYPYEWSFHQLKAAALLTLNIQEQAMQHGMTLKDANAYNVQFIGARPVFIDHLSFELLPEGKPWVAYRQFCEHFLAPLALMHYSTDHLLPMLQGWPDGLPLGVAVSLLPRKSRFKAGLLMHLHLHHKTTKKAEEVGATPQEQSLKAGGLINIVRNLRETVEALEWTPAASHWTEYMAGLPASAYVEPKEQAVTAVLEAFRPYSAVVLGANTGHFAQLAVSTGAYTIALESDAACVQQLCLTNQHRLLLPLVMDLAHPTPALGFAHTERMSLGDRGPADMVLALALIHHLAIGRNIPLPRLAEWMATLGKRLLVEWIPKTDERVQWLLAAREDIFEQYSQSVFEAAFSEYFELEQRSELGSSGRVLYQYSHRG